MGTIRSVPKNLPEWFEWTEDGHWEGEDDRLPWTFSKDQVPDARITELADVWAGNWLACIVFDPDEHDNIDESYDYIYKDKWHNIVLLSISSGMGVDYLGVLGSPEDMIHTIMARMAGYESLRVDIGDAPKKSARTISDLAREERLWRPKFNGSGGGT